MQITKGFLMYGYLIAMAPVFYVMIVLLSQSNLLALLLLPAIIFSAVFVMWLLS